MFRFSRLALVGFIVILAAAFSVQPQVAAQTAPATSPGSDQVQIPTEGVGAPQKERHFVYSLSPWTGKEYGGTFTPPTEDTFYLMAGVDSIVNGVETDVYFWPITKEFMADWAGYKKEIPGTLEVYQDGQRIERLEKKPYTYFWPDGPYSGEMQLLVGDKAEAAFKQYQAAVDGYWKQVQAYYEADATWQKKMDEILQRVRETGKNADPSEIPERPVQPEPPKLYVQKPRDSFIINLGPGNYAVKLVNAAGSVVPGSDRKVEVFTPRRQGIAYQIKPADKWTRPIRSDDASATLYLDGNRTFYLVAYDAQEFNQFRYAKMTNLHTPLAGEGMKSKWTWVDTRQVDSTAVLQVLKDGHVVSEISPAPYYVKQTSGYSLGYEIVPFNPDDAAMQGRNPSFRAYKVDLAAGPDYELRFVDADGKVRQGSVRSVLSVHQDLSWVLFVAPLIPLILGLIVFLWRRGLGKSRRLAAATVTADQFASTREEDR